MLSYAVKNVCVPTTEPPIQNQESHTYPLILFLFIPAGIFAHFLKKNNNNNVFGRPSSLD